MARRADRELSTPERAALMERSRYEATEPYPGNRNARWAARCLICDATLTVVVANLEDNDEQRQMRGETHRTRCSHQRSPRPPSTPQLPLTRGDAKTLLALLEGAVYDPTGPGGRAVNKLQQLAGRPALWPPEQNTDRNTEK